MLMLTLLSILVNCLLALPPPPPQVEKIIPKAGQPEYKYYLFTHVDFDIKYNDDRVIEINVLADPQQAVDISEDTRDVKVGGGWTQLPAQALAVVLQVSLVCLGLPAVVTAGSCLGFVMFVLWACFYSSGGVRLAQLSGTLQRPSLLTSL